jgi:putative transposase
LRQTLVVSERRAWRALGQPRYSQRYAPQLSEAEERLTESIVSLATKHGRYGYRRITTLLQWEGWRVNHKRVERVWRQEGLKVPQRQARRGRLWLNDGSCIRLRPQHPGHVWSYNSVADRSHNGRPLRMLTVIDEYTRECLAIRVGRRLTTEDVQECPTELFCSLGVPEHIRSDNGPEFTSCRIRRWLSELGTRTLFIGPGSPWENGPIESFNGKLRDELLNREIFYTLQEAKVLIERGRQQYNRRRPQTSLGNRPPAPEVYRAPFLRISACCCSGLRANIGPGTETGGSSSGC